MACKCSKPEWPRGMPMPEIRFDVCFNCNDRGWLPCPICKGTKIDPRPLTERVNPRFLELYLHSGMDLNRCGVCSRTGTVKCMICEGTGHNDPRRPGTSLPVVRGKYIKSWKTDKRTGEERPHFTFIEGEGNDIMIRS